MTEQPFEEPDDSAEAVPLGAASVTGPARIRHQRSGRAIGRASGERLNIA